MDLYIFHDSGYEKDSVIKMTVNTDMTIRELICKLKNDSGVDVENLVFLRNVPQEERHGVKLENVFSQFKQPLRDKNIHLFNNNFHIFKNICHI